MSEVAPEVTQSGMRKAAIAWMSGAKKEKCAEIAGVDYSTFFRWTRSPKWKEECESALPELHAEMVRNARAVVMHHLMETKDAKVAMFVLDRLTPKEWNSERTLSVTSEDGKQVAVTFTMG